MPQCPHWWHEPYLGSQYPASHLCKHDPSQKTFINGSMPYHCAPMLHIFDLCTKPYFLEHITLVCEPGRWCCQQTLSMSSILGSSLGTNTYLILNYPFHHFSSQPTTHTYHYNTENLRQCILPCAVSMGFLQSPRECLRPNFHTPWLQTSHQNRPLVLWCIPRLYPNQ